MRTKRISLLVALVFLIGAMTLPMTAFAAGGKDTTPPTLTAVLDGETVKIVSSDDNSGIMVIPEDGLYRQDPCKFPCGRESLCRAEGLCRHR